MATQLKSVLVIGATGVIGRYIIQGFVAERHAFDRVAILTAPENLDKKAEELSSLKEKGVEIITGDITNKEDVLRAYAGFDTVISAIGRNVIKAQIDLIKWAEESSPNIKRFFPSEFGTDIEYGPQSAVEKPHQFKLQVRAYIKDSVKRLEYTYLVTGPYADLYIASARPGQDVRGGSFNVGQKKATLLGSGDDRISLTTMKDVGKLTVAAVRKPAASRNRALIVYSFVTTPNEILAEFERQTGSKWSVEYTPLDELRELEKKAWDSGDAHATGFTLRRIWTEGGTLYKNNDNAEIGVDILGVETLADAVREAVARSSQ